MNKPLSIYVGCALKHATTEYKQSIADLKSQLAQLPGVTILEFLVDPDSTDRDVYTNDIVDCVMQCDLMIAEFSHPSLGLGYEVATMIEKRAMPVMGFAHTDAIVSRLILGIDSDQFSFERYDDMGEIVEKVKNRINL